MKFEAGKVVEPMKSARMDEVRKPSRKDLRIWNLKELPARLKCADLDKRSHLAFESNYGGRKKRDWSESTVVAKSGHIGNCSQ